MKLLHTENKFNERAIAELSIRFAAEAANRLQGADECDLRIQIAAALLKSTILPAICEKYFVEGDGSLVSKLFADEKSIPDAEDTGWDLF